MFLDSISKDVVVKPSSDSDHAMQPLLQRSREGSTHPFNRHGVNLGLHRNVYDFSSSWWKYIPVHAWSDTTMRICHHYATFPIRRGIALSLE